MNSSTYQLFVYGSLRSGFRNPAYSYLTKYFHLVGEAVVRGKFFDSGVNPVAVPTTEAESFINGELYVINNPEEFGWAVEQLDDYEGINVEAGEKPLYRREITEALSMVRDLSHGYIGLTVAWKNLIQLTPVTF